MSLTKPRAHQLFDIDYKQSVRVLTDTDIDLSGGAPATVDGVALAAKDRVLVIGQSVASENGLYYVTTLGTGENGTWQRSLDANETGELLAGAIVMVTEGDVYADTQWKLITNNPIVIGTTELIWAPNSAFAFGNIFANGTAVLADTVGDTVTFTAGNNIEIVGNAAAKSVTIGVTGISLNAIANGTSNVNVVSSGGNVTVGIDGTSNVVVFSGVQTTFAGNIIPAANVTYDLGSDTQRWRDIWLSNSTIHLGNAQISANADSIVLTNPDGGQTVFSGLAPEITATTIVATGNISGGNLSGTNITGTLVTAEQPNITGVGTLSSLAVTGNIVAGNISVSGLETTSGIVVTGDATITGNLTVQGSEFIANVTSIQVSDPLIGLGRGPNNTPLVTNDGLDRGLELWYYTDQERMAFVGYDNANAQLTLACCGTVSNNIVTVSNWGTSKLGNIISTGNVDVDGIVNGNVLGDLTGNVTGNVTGDVTGNILTNAQPNITSVGTLSSLAVTGNISGGNVSATTVSGDTVRANDAGEVRFFDSDSSHYVAFKSADTVGANVTWTLPDADGTVGQVLATDGSGTLIWSTGGGGGGITWTTQANTPPSPASPGDFWYDSVGQVKYQYINDGVSNVWVDQSSPTTFASISTGQIVNTNSSGVGNIGTAVNAFGNVFASFFIGDGSQLTGLPAGYTDANVVSLLSSFGSNSISTTGTIGASEFAKTGSNGVGNIGSAASTFNVVFARATSALYADLAEMYASDCNYEPGTVVVFGGTAEITQSTESHDTRVAGVVSTNPAFLMNSTINDSLELPVALTGRVPCRVQGPIRKGDLVVSGTEPGTAQQLVSWQPGCVIGKSLETIEDTAVRTIEVVVGRF
jgi:hypothetical protein